MDLLRVEGVSKSFGRLVAIDGVSFSVGPQEILGIAGPNGAGKSTLFNLITGTPFHVNSGRILFAGRVIQTLAPHVICRLGIARIYQREQTFADLTVLETVQLAARYGRGKEADRQPARAADRALHFLGLQAKADALPESLSLFEKRKLMLASALATEPKLLLLDEPVAGLSEAEIGEMARLVRRINDGGVAIILIEHVLRFLMAISHRILIMNEGRKLVEGVPQAVIQDVRVVEAYLGRRRDVSAGGG